MSPTNFHDYRHHNNNHRHRRRESNITTTTTVTAMAHHNSMLCPPPLKINRDSHFIRKPSASMPKLASSSSSPSSSSASSAVVSKPPQHRHPVIIYTHSPKVIHTDPKDFMALVQKLTGWSRSEENQAATAAAEEKERKKRISDIGGGNDDNDSTITEEFDLVGGEATGCGQVNSSAPFLTTHLQPQTPPPQQPSHQNTYLLNFPMFANSPEFMCTSQVPYYNFGDSMFLPPNIRTSSLPPPPSFLDNVGDLHEFYDKC